MDYLVREARIEDIKDIQNVAVNEFEEDFDGHKLQTIRMMLET